MATDLSSCDYRNATLPVSRRVEDLLARMTLAEKAGQLFHDMLVMGPSGTLATAQPAFGLPSTDELVVSKSMSHFNLLGSITSVREAVTWHNRLQELARSKTRLGIPITLSTDPRNHFTDNVGTAFVAGRLSQWPETLGFAALGDERLVERFADVARQEYVALGFRLALHPQIDLATEYRWARISGTFGEDAELSGRLGRAYIRGFQGRRDGGGGGKEQSVSCVTKHFPGAGPQMNGEDAHFQYGKQQVYPGGHFDYHLRPFRDAIEEGKRWMMPYYGQPLALPGVEEVGFGFNQDIITTLLKQKLHYRGIVLTDWGLVTHKTLLGEDAPGRAWGCEHLSDVLLHDLEIV